ncbi:Alpha crystallin/Hsp20 domain [Arabidopsis thaliana x Arabidopsis arenosa]|uniref:Alpha crystallin/Hsp20 domain n=1 Tax=Arabidopsis thaliana x Arabidopsis arenosa TaxID=1240361 RepID=A0A8T1YAA1_9BRAS|nr:Alpha crystallin/Hsp20 domain [Arabidopsis thaliana x Arabidopsis arenosa]
MVNPVTLAPQSPDGFYAINNPFLVNGPKGYIEFKTLENEDMYIRFDVPGVPNNGVKVILDQSNKAVCILGDAPKEHKYDASVRSYNGTTLRKKLSIGGINSKIVCKCCDFYSGFTSHMADGVLRLVLTKIHTNTPRPPCLSFLGGPDGEDPYGADPHDTDPHGFPPSSDPNDPNLTGPILMPHPCVGQGSQRAYESKVLQNGGLYVRVDMPGVPKENFTVSVMNGRVKVTGEAPAHGHDSAGRFYSGDVAVLSTPVDLPVRKIKTIAKNGVIRLVIPPV